MAQRRTNQAKATVNMNEEKLQLTDEEIIDLAAIEILKTYREAFEELAK